MSIVIENFHACPSGKRVGFVDITTPEGIGINGIAVFRNKDGSRGIDLPRRRLSGDDGSVAYMPVVYIRDKAKRRTFIETLLKALEEYFAGELV